MPRKPKLEKRTITVVVDGSPITVSLHPPSGARKSWYAYRSGLVASKATGQRNLEDAIVVVESMLRNWKAGRGAQRPAPSTEILTNEEFEVIQRAHYERKTDPAAWARAQKSLTVCLEAIKAFQAITRLDQISLATPDDCARFQREALERPKNWRQHYPRGKKPEESERISPNTVLKWSRALQAAFERANRNAGKKCVRGVVPEARLLAVNPWNQFDWIEGRDRPIRQFDAGEINSLLDYLEAHWKGVTVASIMVKLFLWSACRQQEIAGLRWDSLRRVGDEVHFEIVGKWGVERWFRIPTGLYHELEVVRVGNPFVLAAYNGQLRQFHEAGPRPHNARQVSETFDPQCLGDWFADRMDDWSASLPTGHAYTHVLRKTTLQYARVGEDVNRQVASDARVGEAVMMASHVRETDDQLRQASNRTFGRIMSALPADLACRLGYCPEKPENNLEEELRRAINGRDWARAHELTACMVQMQQPQVG